MRIAVLILLCTPISLLAGQMVANPDLRLKLIPPAPESSSQRDFYDTLESEGEQEDEGQAPRQACSETTYRGTFVSLGFIESIAPGGISYDGISINENGELEGDFVLGTHINACFSPKIVTRKVGNNIFIRVRNAYFDREEGLPVGADASATIDEKYEACMRESGLVTDTDKGWQINVDKAIADKRINHRVAFSYGSAISDSIKGLDKNETYHLYFGSNSTADIKTPGERVPNNPGWTCSSYKRLSTDQKPFYKGTLGTLLDDAAAYCDDRNPKNLLNGIIRMQESSVGNAGKILSSLEQVLINGLEERQQELFKTARDIKTRMSRVTKKCKKQKCDVDDFDENPDNIAKEHQAFMESLENDVYAPAKTLLARLHEQYNNSKDTNEKNAIAKKTKQIAGMLGDLHKRNKDTCGSTCRFYKEMYVYGGMDGMEQNAANFERLRLTSKYASRAYKGRKRGKPRLSLKKVERNIRNSITKFENRVLNDWYDQADVLSGGRSGINNIPRRIASARKEQAKFIREGPFKGLGICRFVSSKRCNKRRRFRMRMFHRKIEQSNLRIGRQLDRLDSLQELQSIYQERTEREREESGEDDYFDEYDYDYSYSNTEFSLLGPQYGSPPWEAGSPHYQQQIQMPYPPDPYSANPYHLGWETPETYGPPPPQSSGPRVDPRSLPPYR